MAVPRSLLRLGVLIVVIVAVASIPLFVIYRSECPGDDGPRTRWSFVPPFSDPPAECRQHENGFEVLAGELGL